MKLHFYILFVFMFSHIDAGAQWVIKNLEENSYKLGNIKFQNDSLGYLIGGDSYFLRTQNTGENWEKLQIDTQINIDDYQLIGDSSIFAVGDSKLVKSMDFGENWDSISSLSKKQLHTLWFFDNDTGIVAGYDGIYKTVDNGISWDTVWSVTQQGYKYGEIKQIYFPSSNIGYAIGMGRNQTNNPGFDNFLLKSADSGKTWEKIKIFSGSLTTICFTNEETGFVGTETGTIHKTEDAGNNWTESLKTNGGPVRSIQFISETKGYATGGVTGYVTSGGYYSFFISQTVDAGQTWATYDTTGIPLNSICFIDENIGFVAGEFELIMKSNGGINFLPEDYPWHLVEDTGINEKEGLDFGFNIYPNPTNGILIVQKIIPTEKIVNVRLFNMSGKQIDIRDKVVTPEEIQLNTSALAPGTYIIQVVFDNRVKAKKFVKR